MSEAGLFERFLQFEAEACEVEVLEAAGQLPAFIVQAYLLPESEEMNLRRSCEEFPKKFKRGQPRQRELNEVKYWPKWTKKVIHDWHGLTRANLKRLGATIQNADEFDRMYPDEIPYSQELADLLCRKVHNSFSAIVALELMTIREERKDAEEEEREDALGNSGNGLGSTSTSAATSMSPDGAHESTLNATGGNTAPPSNVIGS